MVGLSDICRSNAGYAAQDHRGLVCVFAGATAGIDAATLREMVGLLHSSTFYILGRGPNRNQDKLDELKRICPTNDVVFVETQIAPISGIDKVYRVIHGAAEKVDMICSSRPRVLSILNGTKEKKIDEEDIGLEGHWGIAAAVNHTTMCMSLASDHLASSDSQKHITFLHVTPGFVSTDTPRTAYPLKSDGLAWWAFISFVQIVAGWIIKYLGMAAKESGERHAYELTSVKFVPGSWRVNHLNEVVPDNQVVIQYQENGWCDKIWEFTFGVWEKALAEGVEP